MEVAGSVLAASLLLLRGPFIGKDNRLSAKSIWRTLTDTTYSGNSIPSSIASLYLTLYSTSEASVRVTKRIEKHLLRPADGLAQVEAFRTAFTQSFSMVGVAGAITAQIGITALSLPQLESTHWTAQSSFVLALVSGCLCVYFACSVQGILRDLHGPGELMRWLTRPGPLPGVDDRNEAHTGTNLHTHRRPSAQAATILSMPAEFLKSSLFFLILGLGLYFVLPYAKDVGPVQGRHAALATMVIYILGTTICFQQFWSPYFVKKIMQMLEDDESTDATEANGPFSREDVHSVLGPIAAALENVIKTQEAQLQAQRALLETLQRAPPLGQQAAEVK